MCEHGMFRWHQRRPAPARILKQLSSTHRIALAPGEHQLLPENPGHLDGILSIQHARLLHQSVEQHPCLSSVPTEEQKDLAVIDIIEK